MDNQRIDNLFTPEVLKKLFPAERSNEFFDALFGDASEGAYDIHLAYRGVNQNSLVLELELHERPGKCLACNLTQGLPTVFSRHPIINVSGLVDDVNKLLSGKATCTDWSLGYTEQRQKDVHVIPLTIQIEAA